MGQSAELPEVEPKKNPRKPKRNETARAAGSRMLGNVKVKTYIDEISEYKK